MTVRSPADGTDARRDGRAPPGAPARRLIERRRGLPGGRAVLGGLLVTLAGVGTLVTWQRASGAPDGAYVVADRPLEPGETIAAGDVRLAAGDLPADVAAAAFTDPAAVGGRVALGPIGEGELVQQAEVSDVGAALPVAEVSLALARDRAVDGRLHSGDLVDVFATFDDRTDAVAERVRVVAVSGGDGASFAADAQLTVTLALLDTDRRAAVVHAARAGEVTLVRSTHLPGATVPAPGATTPVGGSQLPPAPVEPAAGGDGGSDGDGSSAAGDGGGGPAR